jgi:hypothetical protein
MRISECGRGRAFWGILERDRGAPLAGRWGAVAILVGGSAKDAKCAKDEKSFGWMTCVHFCRFDLCRETSFLAT